MKALTIRILTAILLCLVTVACVTACGASKGLNFTLNDDKQSYSVIGIGSCRDTDILIPSTYDGKPVTRIGEKAFYWSKNLTSIEIPDSVTSIGYGAFKGCDSLKSIVIPDSVTSIGESAFWYCSSLESIEIPDSVTSIGKYAFDGCKSLKSITFHGTKEQWKAISKGSFWNEYTGNYVVHCTDGVILE